MQRGFLIFFVQLDVAAEMIIWQQQPVATSHQKDRAVLLREKLLTDVWLFLEDLMLVLEPADYLSPS